jgi:hypothetical protein
MRLLLARSRCRLGTLGQHPFYDEGCHDLGLPCMQHATNRKVSPPCFSCPAIQVITNPQTRLLRLPWFQGTALDKYSYPPKVKFLSQVYITDPTLMFRSAVYKWISRQTWGNEAELGPIWNSEAWETLMRPSTFWNSRKRARRGTKARPEGDLK